jgi:hypothetical protein
LKERSHVSAQVPRMSRFFWIDCRSDFVSINTCKLKQHWYDKYWTVHMNDLQIKLTYHLMPIFMLFLNIIIALLANSILSPL